METYLAYWVVGLTVLAMLVVYHTWKAHREMFDNKNEEGLPSKSHEDYDKIYDEFYASVYDKLFTIPERISFEKASIKEYGLHDWPKKEVREILLKVNLRDRLGLRSAERRGRRITARCV